MDVTSQTQVEAYTRLGVPELWVYGEGELTIDILQSGQYQRSERSAIFPNLPILAWVPELLAQSITIGRSQALRTLPQKIRSLPLD